MNLVPQLPVQDPSVYRLFKDVYSVSPLHTKPGLYNGTLGLALAQLFHSKMTGNDEALKDALSFFQAHLNHRDSYGTNHKFGYGLTGLGWATQFLINQNIVPEGGESFLEELDARLASHVLPQKEYSTYNLPLGVLGYGVYWMERLRSGKNEELHRRMLETIVDHIEQLSFPMGANQLAWIDQYTCLYTVYRTGEPFFNLQFAYGIPSIVVFLAHCHQLGIRTEKTSKMIRGTVNWMALQKAPDKSYPERIYIDGETDSGSCHSAWSEGTLGVAVAYWAAASVLDEKCWLDKSLEVLRLATQTDSQNEGMVNLSLSKDISLGKGAAGMAFLMHKFYRLTQKEELKEAADHWMTICWETLEKPARLKAFSKDKGILSGGSGLVLAALEYNQVRDEKHSFNWDSMLLTDIERLPLSKTLKELIPNDFYAG